MLIPYFIDDEDFSDFPNPELSDIGDGLVAWGGDLHPERVIQAYARGIFPWYGPESVPIWYCPDPRYVIYPERVKIHQSMKQVLRSKKLRVTFDQDFLGVMAGCRDTLRNKQPNPHDTWITDEFIETYYELHLRGLVHSVEVWQENELVGGLYGGCMGKCFFGESMFAKVSNASKVGLIMLAKNLAEHRFELIDCQVDTPHLLSLGAEAIPRQQFLQIVDKNKQFTFEKVNWNDIFRTDFVF